MSVRWVVLKYMPDLQRREPRNLAVAVMHGGKTEIRALGQKVDGSIDGRAARGTVQWVDNYKGWIHYWEALAEEGAPLEEWLSMRGGDNYLVELGGEQVYGEAPASLASYADEVYAAMVAPVTEEASESERFDRSVSTLLRKSGLLERKDYVGPERLTAANGETYKFPHMWKNGHVTVATTMPKFSTTKARDILWQFEHLPPVATGRILFTRAVLSESDNATAQILEQQAVVLPVEETTPDDAVDAFERASAA